MMLASTALPTQAQQYQTQNQGNNYTQEQNKVFEVPEYARPSESAESLFDNPAYSPQNNTHGMNRPSFTPPGQGGTPPGQGGIPGCGPSGNQPPKCDTEEVPIGGLGILALLGIGYASKELYQNEE